MNNLKYIIIFIYVLFGINPLFTKDCYKEIHSKHFIYGMPLGVPEYNDLIIRDSYALSSNDSTKFADWVAYYLDSATIIGNSIERSWSAEPWLSEDETLEPADYKDANKIYKYDRGHQAPLANFKGNRDIETTNYLSNITPQKADLNQGMWKILEDFERQLALKYKKIWVMTGPIYENEMPSLPNADEPHKVPSAYWKIISIPINNEEIKVLSFIMDQNTPRKSELQKYLVNLLEVERRTKLTFFNDLDQNIKSKLINKIDIEFFENNFNSK